MKIKFSRRFRIATALVALVLAFGAGYWLSGSTTAAPPAESAASATATATEWTCSMHPQIRRPGPGLCPICAMDLVPVATAATTADSGPRTFVTTADAKALMNIQTAPVERRFVTAEIRMVGKVDYDETKLAFITAWIPGRLDRLYVDFTGVRVEQGDHMVSLYSPALLTAQEELARAAKGQRTLRPDSPETLRRTAESTVEAARQKLNRFGLTDAQIEKVEKEGVTSDHVTIYAPTGGTVVERMGQEGSYVETGTDIYAIADLSEVWVKLDAYESDLSWLHYGQDVVFATEAFPGEDFVGRIAFIDPVLNPDTRTVKVRVNVPNKDGKLKPGMFVRATVRSQVATDGRVMNPALAGKWISPMHPEIVKDAPGNCDVCGMALVPAKELGYVSLDENAEAKPLVIPATAALLTGKRAVVYVEKPGADQPTYEGREIELGARAGDYYIVRRGLSEGERVVVNGNFKIDSAMQILAKRSMMMPEPDAVETAADPALVAAADGLFDRYTAIHEALIANDAANANAAAAAAEGEAQLPDWLTDAALRGHFRAADVAFEQIANASDIAAQRIAFEQLSVAMKDIIAQTGLSPGRSVQLVHCPMAFDSRGAEWLQPSGDVRNPYFGPVMLDCGTVERTLVDEHGHAPH